VHVVITVMAIVVGVMVVAMIIVVIVVFSLSCVGATAAQPVFIALLRSSFVVGKVEVGGWV
jgi:hypothetical protein